MRPSGIKFVLFWTPWLDVYEAYMPVYLELFVSWAMLNCFPKHPRPISEEFNSRWSVLLTIHTENRTINLHAKIWNSSCLCYLWEPKVTFHLNIYDSLLRVVFGTTTVIYLVLPLNMYMQMVQNVCFYFHKKFPYSIPMGFFWQKYIAFSKPSMCIWARVSFTVP